jgi:hypothetical protein
MINYSIGLMMVLLLIGCDDRVKREKALKDLELAQEKIVEVKNEIASFEVQLDQHLGELEVAKDDINQVKEFQILRTEAEREQQIRNATEYKIRIENNIEIIQGNIAFLKDSLQRTESRIIRLKEILKD